MAIEDDSLYAKWKKTFTKLDLRRRFYETVKIKYPADHVMVQRAKAKLDEAEAAHEKVCNKL
jgi:hypothetical protein